MATHSLAHVGFQGEIPPHESLSGQVRTSLTVLTPRGTWVGGLAGDPHTERVDHYSAHKDEPEARENPRLRLLIHQRTAQPIIASTGEAPGASHRPP